MPNDGKRRTPYADDVLTALNECSFQTTVSMLADAMTLEAVDGPVYSLEWGDRMAQYLADRGIYLTRKSGLPQEV